MTKGGAALALALAGGGTPGPLVPGLHLLRHLSHPASGRPATPLADVLWFVAGRPVEESVLHDVEELLGDVHLERAVLRLEPGGGGAPSRARLVRRLLPEVRVARRALRRHGTDVLLGLGGFTCLPAVLAARTLGIPIALLEINAARGRATRWLGPLAARVFHAWPSTFPNGAEGKGRHILIGPPLAPELTGDAPDDAACAAARTALGFAPEQPLLVVLGGSQGAQALNEFCARHAASLVAGGVQVLHQVGPGRRAEGPDDFPGYRAVEYVADVPLALAASTVVLCRGGASTLAEVAALGRPAFVVPYPHHGDRHQERNARCLGEGVRIVPQEDLGEATVTDLLALSLPDGAARRAAMTRALRAAVPRDAAQRIGDELLRFVGRDK